MDMPNSMVGDIDIQKYGIRSISMISEATWAPRLLIKHLDGKEFSYTIARDINKNIEDLIETKMREHIRKECIVKLRKEKLEKINEI